MRKGNDINADNVTHRTKPTAKPRAKSGAAESYARLVEAAARRGIVGELAIAQALRYTEQSKVNNWQRRGVSKSGALDAEKFLACSAVWILEGIDPFKD